MNKRKRIVLVAILAVITAVCIQQFYVLFLGSGPASPTDATPLDACQAVTPNLSEGLCRWYRQLCSTNLEERYQGVLELPWLDPSERVVFLPLLSEIMATDDYVIKISDGRYRYFFIAKNAGERMADSGLDAVPFFIKALQSKKTLEIHAGLNGAERLLSVLGRGQREKTNELRVVSISLLPYVHRLTTISLPEAPMEFRSFYGTIPYGAQRLEGELKRFLSPAASNE